VALDVGQVAEPADVDAISARKLLGPPRLIRETPEPVAECPACGARMALGAEGTTWTIRTPRDVADRLILQLGGLEREELLVLLLNTRNMVVGQVTVYRGNVSSSLVRTGELFTEAVRRGVARVILVHNHPSGDPTPSVDDVALTANAIAAGRLLDIEVLDHVIVGGATFASLRDRGSAFDASVPARHANSKETGDEQGDPRWPPHPRPGDAYPRQREERHDVRGDHDRVRQQRPRAGRAPCRREVGLTPTCS
jgi:RadC-like JAB domain